MISLSKSIRIWGSILVLLMVSGILFSPVSGDAPFYISVARDISHGVIPYQQIRLSYTPLAMYFNSVIWTIFKQPSYFLFVTFQYLVILCSALVLYKISLKLSLEKGKAIFLSLFFAICVLSADGSYINLEVYSILFMLLAYLMLLNRNVVASGFLLGLTFFCKQYGILNFVPFALIIFFNDQEKFKSLVKLALGGLIPLLIFLAYYCLLKAVPLSELFAQLTGQGYGERSFAEAKSVAGFLNGAKIFIMLALPLVFLKFNPFKDRVQLALTIGILFSLLPVFVQQFQHYFLNAFPYVAILIAMNWSKREFKLWPMHVALTVATLFLGLRIATYWQKAIVQKRVATELKKIYPEGTAVYLKGQTNYLYILNDYRNPALLTASYDYAFNTDAAFLQEHIVLSDAQIPNAIPERITSVSGTKIYEY